MRILYVGDVVGRAGRSAVLAHAAQLRARLRLDALVVNGENAAGGYGLTPAILTELFAAGVDLVTTGNHVFDQKELVGTIGGEPRLLRPLNMAPGTPGRGAGEVRTARGRRLLVLQVMGRLFMGLWDDPFRALEAELGRQRLAGTADAILVDVHAEATSEKMALAHFLDGRVSLVAGTHTHVPTADAQILPGGTAYITDVGMTGDYDSVIGMDKEGSIRRWRSDLPAKRLEPAGGEATLCAVFVETDEATGLARRVAPVRLGGRLAPAWPEGLD
ncbi:MAG: YmdB family metallophosphoesterase [Geminicoccaceae bacterium]|nr:YmdB family metallophosphoesterase [Geminicoccaceae bacterium]MCX8102370.1 YmdB family metallophosphoesterase [Geminicoccaceae bacterium]MDW8370233.1 TIGR00282 family metallophosphoesterase [Geminicoccaceae bacterium]